MPVPALSPLAVFLACALISVVATRLLLGVLRDRVLDRPNPRSSHSRPIPRGGGWGVLAALLPAWVGIALGAGEPGLLVVLAAAGLLLAVSWIDDVRGLSPAVRLPAHAVAVALGLLALPAEQAVLQGWLPLWLDRAVAGLAWLWFVNLYNFMDGIDGIAGGETITIGLGLALVLALSAGGQPPVLLAMALAGAACGFLVWNWHPARIFLGDVGSVPIGFLAGYLLLDAAGRGLWAPALILPGYFLADATVTLLRRLMRGDRIWRPHREHYYQRMVRAGARHDWVVRRVLTLNLALIGLSVVAASASPAGAALAVAAGASLVAGLLLRFATLSRGAPA